MRLALFAIAVASLVHQVESVSMHDIRADLGSHGAGDLLLSVVLTSMSFAAMAGFEVLGMRYLATDRARRIPLPFTAATSFVANAFSQSAGVAILTGTAVRLRAYRQHGLSNGDLVRLSSFVTITATLGLLIASASSFLVRSGTTTTMGYDIATRPLGVLLMLPVIAYSMWFMLRPQAVYGRGSFSFAAPTRRIGLVQLTLSSIDWILAASVFFFLLPQGSHLTFFNFLPIFFFAQSAAMMSHVPGGAGVFESILLGLIAHSPQEKAGVLASLLAYRLLYYALPLVAAIITGAVFELRQKQVILIPAEAA